MAFCSPTNPHFFQPLLPGFTKHLDIPVAFFLKHLDKSNKGKTAKLRSDASETTWNVKLDGRRFSDGWEYFAVAHDLRVGDIVVFRHEGELVFYVTALGPSCCEIQYGEEDSQEEDKSEELCDTMEKISRMKKRPKTEKKNSEDQSCFVITVTESNLRRDIVYLPKAFAVVNCLMKKLEIVLMNEERESWKLYLTQESYSSRFYMSKGWRSFCVANGKKPGDMFTFKMVQNEATPVLKLLPLNNEDLHKLVDTEEVPKKKRQDIEADSSFVAIVTASNIRRDTMYLPKKFAASNGLKSKFKIDLMNEKGESWTIELRHEPYSGRFLIRSGWRSFCVANGKKPGDMFNFKLIRNVETPVLKLFHLNLPKLEPSNDTRQGFEATEKEFLGVQTNRDDSRQEPTNEAIRKGKWLEANETTIKEENITTSENRFVTLILTTSKLDLPLEFTKGNGIKNAEKIKMIDRYGTTWSTSLLMDKKKRGAMKLGKGCIRFCEVNGVKMGESFVLELVWEDTVPAEDVLRASSVKRYGKKKHRTVPLPRSADPDLANQSGHQHAIAYVEGGKFYGAKATINVWEPKVQSPNEFSLSQLWILGGSFGQDLNSIEAGWQVSPDLYGDNNTRLFTYWTSDAYQATGCYNLLCSGFIQVNSQIAMGASISPVSGFHNPQYDISITIWKDPKEGHWWMQFGDGYVLGYWPSFLFSYLADSASIVEWGGEVVNMEEDGHHTTTQMGSGQFPDAGFSKASYFRNIQVVDSSNNLKEPKGINTFTEKSNCYDVEVSKNDDWGHYFYYGGPGRNANCQ